MKTVILEVDESVYSQLVSFLELLPSNLCHLAPEEKLNQAEMEEINTIRDDYARGSRDNFDDWEKVRDKL